jgi:hypothetical protein
MKFLRSKTVWLNLLSLTYTLVGSHTPLPVVEPGTLAIITTIANLVLRTFVTKTPILAG